MRAHVIAGVEVVECGPDEVAAAVGRRVVAYMPMAQGEQLYAQGAFERVGVRADAYATTEERLHEALAFVAAEDRDARTGGPLRLVWLGSLGSDEPRTAGPIGRTFPIEGKLIVGRSADCGIVLRCGPHSDQNIVARRHATVERVHGVVHVRDLGSTNGTWKNGRRLEAETVAPGDEIAFACTHRFRLDGG